MNIPAVFWLVPVASLVALGMAYYFFRSMMSADEGTPRMKEIALYVRKGAMAYLWQQYKVVLIVFVVLCVLFTFMAFGLNVQNREPLGAVCLPHRWFLLRTGRLLRHEDRHLRFSPYC